MDRHEIERLRRSVAMIPPGQQSAALTKAQAEDLLEELSRLDVITGRYRQVLDQLRQILAAADDEQA